MGMETEVIEIGIALLQNMEVKLVDSVFVLPVTSTISDFCEEFTGISQELIEVAGIPFEDACKKLAEFKHIPWATWANFPMDLFNDTCSHFDYPFNGYHTTMQSYSELFSSDKKMSLKQATEHFCGEYIGTPNIASDDAHNLARLALAWIENKNVPRDSLTQQRQNFFKSNFIKR